MKQALNEALRNVDKYAKTYGAAAGGPASGYEEIGGGQESQAAGRPVSGRLETAPSVPQSEEIAEGPYSVPVQQVGQAPDLLSPEEIGEFEENWAVFE
jgi:hypothetical protein